MFPVKYKPFGTLESFLGSFDGDLFPTLRSWLDREVETEEFRLPRTDISETDDGYVLSMEMPGVEKKNVSVSVENDQLVVSGERTETTESKNVLRREIRSEKFRRTFTIDGSIDREKIKAKLENGLLEIKLAKKPDRVGRTITID